MPTDIAVIVAGITLVFVVFAVALAWADFYSSRAPKERARTGSGQAHQSPNGYWRCASFACFWASANTST